MKKYFFLTLAFLDGFYSCQAQVAVRNEPRHHNIFENGTVRILDVHIPPGDTSQFHIHSTPSVFLVLTDVKTGSQVVSEEDHSNAPIPHYGNIWFEGFYKQPRIHRVWNTDTSAFHVMDIELIHKAYGIIDSPIRENGFSFLFDEIPVRAYRLILLPHQDIHLPERKADILLIQLSDPDGSVRVNEQSLHKKGDYIFVAAGKSISIKNEKAQKAEFAIFELK